VKIVLLSFSVGAMGHYVAGMANPLVESGHDVVVFIDDETPIECFHKDVVVKRCKVPQFFDLKNITRLFYFPSIIFEINHFVKSWQPDIIHFNSSHWYFRFLIGLKKYAPTLVTIHDIYAHPGTSEKVEEFKKKPMRSTCSTIVVHSELLKQQAIEKWGMSDKMVQTIPLCTTGGLSHWVEYLDTSEMSGYDSKKILFFGRIRKYKGIDIMLKSFETIRKKIPNAQLIVAGQGEFDMPNDFTNIVVKNDFLSDEDAARVVSESAIVVAPYIEATASTLPAIAAIFSKPLVGSNICGIKDFVQNEKTGLLVEPNDSTALADACIRLLNSPDECKKMGQAAKIFNEVKSNPTKIAQNLIAIYKSCK
jgi:glycosyltransferase involved in cell wall biosynthesis